MRNGTIHHAMRSSAQPGNPGGLYTAAGVTHGPRSGEQRMFNNARQLILTALLFAVHSLLAQQDTGLITGQVLDESGAPIANASVEIKNIGTGIVSKVKTGQEGSYTTQPLRIGTYSVTVEAQGFKRAIRENLTLNV